MRRIYYPAIFTNEGEDGYSVIFWDISISTCGQTLQEAMFMAEDVLKMTIDDYIKEKKRIPVPSRIEEVELKTPLTSYIQYIGVDILDA